MAVTTEQSYAGSAILQTQKKKRSSGERNHRGGVFIVGTLFVAVACLLAVLIPYPSPFQIAAFAVALAIGAAGFATGLTGMLHLSTNTLTASGTFCVFVIIFLVIVRMSDPEDTKFLALFGQPNARIGAKNVSVVKQHQMNGTTK